MPFKKGQPAHPNAGRPKGSLSKKTLLKTTEVLVNANKNPVEEILKLLPFVDEETQIKTWLSLLPYIEAKITEIEKPANPAQDAAEKLAEVPSSELKKLIAYENKDAK